MAHPVLETEECIGCGICVDACPQDVLEIAGGVVVVENEDACIACGDCEPRCPFDVPIIERMEKTEELFGC